LLDKSSESTEAEGKTLESTNDSRNPPENTRKKKKKIKGLLPVQEITTSENKSKKLPIPSSILHIYTLHVMMGLL